MLASADYCPVAALEYDFPAMSTQFHPEYAPAFITAIANMLEGDLLSPEQADRARASAEAGRVAASLYGREVAAFFRRHLAG